MLLETRRGGGGGSEHKHEKTMFFGAGRKGNGYALTYARIAIDSFENLITCLAVTTATATAETAAGTDAAEHRRHPELRPGTLTGPPAKGKDEKKLVIGLLFKSGK